MATASFDLADLNGSNGFTLNGVASGDISGSSVSNAGDVNGDGIDDLIIGARGADPNGYSSGQSYVVFGGTEIGATGTLELSSLDGSNGFTLNGVASGDYLGRSVSNAGDVNGDGIDDLIIGAFGADPNSSASGQSYVVFGGTEIGATGTLELSSLDGSNGFALNGVASEDISGSSVSNAGDVNGDGIDDLIIGAPGADPNGPYSGQSYVVFGGTEVGTSGTLELSSLDGSNGFTLNAVEAFDDSPSSVSNAGDVNGDGFDDLIIGASGKSYVVFGATEVGATGTLELSNLDGSNGFLLKDDYASEVSGAGDVNGDGFDDLIIGAPVFDPYGYSSRSGRSYVVFGGTEIGTTGSLELSSLDVSNGFALNEVASQDYSGSSVSNAGDINGDGIDDLIIGALGADPNGSFSGQSYVVFGFGFKTINGTSDDDLLIGTPGRDLITSFEGNDTIISKEGDDIIDGGSGDDLIVGQEGNDNLTGGGNQDKFAMALGEGTDTITDFGGVGKGGPPPQEILDEVDVLQFFGEGLTAENMLLTQQGSELEITFEGAENTQVILQDFALEDLENRSSGIGNILFDGQQEIQDNFAVLNADSMRSKVFKPNTVTFLNDQDNITQGFEDSDDVINAQGGKDILLGRSGDDLLRGGEGNDLVDGGAGDDLLDGGAGDDSLLGGVGVDRFVLREGEGADTIFDFEDGIDVLLLADGLEFEQLGIESSNGDTLISITDTDELLASLIGVDAGDINSEDFAILGNA